MTILSAEALTMWELCPLRKKRVERYATRVSLMGALYRSLDAGLRTGKNPEQASQNELMSIASSPGLDVISMNVYGVATHLAWLSGILAQALRNAFPAPWSDFPDLSIGNPDSGGFRWRSGLYNAGDGIPRRLVLVDRWSDDRKASERRGWRTIGEAVMLGGPIAVTAIEIGPSRDKHRVSPWTRCYRHPKNDIFRFRRRESTEDFSRSWKAEWREDSGIPTAEWLARMQNDGCMDVVQTINVPPPVRREDFLERMSELAKEMERSGHRPPMRLSGCNDVIHGPCPFQEVCFGSRKPAEPETYGFRLRAPKPEPLTQLAPLASDTALSSPGQGVSR